MMQFFIRNVSKLLLLQIFYEQYLQSKNLATNFESLYLDNSKTQMFSLLFCTVLNILTQYISQEHILFCSITTISSLLRKSLRTMNIFVVLNTCKMYLYRETWRKLNQNRMQSPFLSLSRYLPRWQLWQNLLLKLSAWYIS